MVRNKQIEESSAGELIEDCRATAKSIAEGEPYHPFFAGALTSLVIHLVEERDRLKGLLQEVDKSTQNTVEHPDQGLQRWEFTAVLEGSGINVDEAWDDAVDSFTLDPGEPHTWVMI